MTLELSDYLDAEIAVVDRRGTIVRCNRKWENTARTGLLAQRRSPWNYIAECDAATRRHCREAAGIRDGLLAVLQGEAGSFVATYACPFNELHHWFQVQIAPLEYDGERHAVLMHVDVSALQRDALTGLPNRAMFDAQLDLALALARGVGRHPGAIIVDMDGLKLINDVHGHRVGDRGLKLLAAELRKMIAPHDIAARIGGDEFGVVVMNDFDALSLRRLRARFRSGLACETERGLISVSASVGIALYPGDGVSATALLAAADKSMYAEKRAQSAA